MLTSYKGENIMKYAEENFYKNDEKKYDLKNNREFLMWFLNSIDSGVKPSKYTKMEDFEGLINSVVDWYKLKYPSYVLNSFYKFNVKDISKELDIKQFLHRLPLKQYSLMKPDYETNYLSLKGQTSNYKYSYRLLFNSQRGVVKESNIPDFIGLTLEEVLYLLKKYQSSVDYRLLEQTIQNYNFKIELRHRLLELASLKMLYKSENIQEGYTRSKHFIEEFNDELGLLLSSSEIDNLYKEYTDDKKKLRKRLEK